MYVDDSTYSIYFVERLPLFVRHSQALRRLDGPLHLTRPHFQICDVLFLDELPQTFGILEHEMKSNENNHFSTKHGGHLISGVTRTSFPLADRAESPPIRPLMFRSLSPWRHR